MWFGLIWKQEVYSHEIYSQVRWNKPKWHLAFPVCLFLGGTGFHIKGRFYRNGKDWLDCTSRKWDYGVYVCTCWCYYTAHYQRESRWTRTCSRLDCLLSLMKVCLQKTSPCQWVRCDFSLLLLCLLLDLDYVERLQYKTLWISSYHRNNMNKVKNRHITVYYFTFNYYYINSLLMIISQDK